MAYSGPFDADTVEAQYLKWKDDPESVTADWRWFFQGFELGYGREAAGEGVCDEESMRRQSAVEALIHRYRDLGHLVSCLDPLESCPTAHPLLDLKEFGLTEADLPVLFHAPDLDGGNLKPLSEILKILKETYCRSVGVEYMHIQDPVEREWLRARMESSRNRPAFGADEKIRILYKLSAAKRFEQFLHRTYLGQKRFSLEGAEVIVPMLDELFHHAAARGAREVVLGMAHRGRLNVQVNVMDKLYEDMFRDFEDQHNPAGEIGTGDVKYHKGFRARLRPRAAEEVEVVMADNPSHLESVDPVVEGVARARQEALGPGSFREVLPVLVHGDAAFAGQGVVTETLNMSGLSGYRTGGTIHIIINNQIGYTTPPEDARSTRYSTDVAKGFMTPIFHVHGEDPEAVLSVARLATDWRAAFGKDAVIDVVCYRLYGHNEGDEPYFTQPLMYERIRNRKSLDVLYSERLTEEKVLDGASVERIFGEVESCLKEAHAKAKKIEKGGGPENHAGKFPAESGAPDTRVSGEMLLNIARSINRAPEGFSLHPKLQKILEKRLSAVEGGQGLDWACAEALAFGTILLEGLPVRLSGEDSQRGTFSQRHAVLFDVTDDSEYTPLANLSAKQGVFEPVNSLLSEAGVLGFEYGHSIARPQGLTIWEAQFGDFANNAQVVIDQYISSGEAKWRAQSGLVMLLPHGYEGMGPEHSSARLERFLSLCAMGSMRVCYPTLPAQYFHLLRRQALDPVRKPLIVMAPKSLLRHPRAVSGMADFTDAGFRPVLSDSPAGKSTTRVVFHTGRLFFDLLKAREQKGAENVALVRLEELYPFPEKELKALAAGFSACREWVWAQEEPENMGAWPFVAPLFRKLLGLDLRYAGRDPSPSPVTAYHHVYSEEQEKILKDALAL